MLMTAEPQDSEADDQPFQLARPSSRRDDVDMDITPMIDITFLLLIFFIVSSTPDQQTAIDLPMATHGDGVSQIDSVVFTIAEGGVNAAPLYAADGRIAGTELPDDPEGRREQVRELVTKGFRENKTNVIIKGDKNVAYRNVAQLITSISQVQGVKIHLAVLDSN